MRSILRLACVAAIVVLALPSPARAGAADQQPATPSAVGLRAFGIVDLDALAATQSFNAVLGTSKLKAFGGGVEIVDIWKHVFARVAVTRARKTGSRVVVANGQVFPLGIPLTVTMTPVELGGGWRFAMKSSRLTPYAGAAFLSLGYTDTSKFAEPGEDTSTRFKGQDLFAGAEVGIVKWLSASAEVQYRRVPNAIGAGGASKDFGESNLGGVTARVTIGIRTRR